jgi:NAD(P)-dependent dehydrogenase (short-subunit alcohol dehydrogenase family)
MAIITGASSGIGRAAALRLARDGWKVVVCARRRAPLDALATEVAAAGGEAVVEALDASDGDAVVAMAARVTAEHGVPDAVVNCAGAGRWLYIEDTSPQEIRSMIGAPYLAAFHTTHAFMKGMLQARRGLIVHVNSPAGVMPWGGATGYASARFALRGLHEALRMDLVGTGVRSSHVIFGEVTTSYFDANPDSHEHIPAVARLIPVSTPEQCGEWLARAIEAPRDTVCRPFMLRLFIWAHAAAPWLVRFLVRRTQRRRPTE